MVHLEQGIIMTKTENNIQCPVILYKDEDLLLVNKPAGLLSIADGYDPSLAHLRDVLEPDYGELWIVHRLDKDTSGIIAIAVMQMHIVNSTSVFA